MDVHLAQPGPLKAPKTFCEPCAVKIAPSASRKGSLTHEEEVAVNLRTMAVAFRFGLFWNQATIKLLAAEA